MSAEILSNLVITKVHSVSTMYTPQNKKSKKKDRPRWAVVIKYEGETVYTSNGKCFLSDIGHTVIGDARNRDIFPSLNLRANRPSMSPFPSRSKMQKRS